MELTLWIVAWLQAMALTAFSFYQKDRPEIPIIAGVNWILVGVFVNYIQIIGFDSMGNGSPYTLIAAPTWQTGGQLAFGFLCGGIGIVLLYLSGAWILNGGKTGENV